MARIKEKIALLVCSTVCCVAGFGQLAAPAEEPPEKSALAASRDVQRTMDKYRALRPGAKDLAWFSLDWATTLKEAKDRAAREHRPVLFLHTNGRGNLYCGFC